MEHGPRREPVAGGDLGITSISCRPPLRWVSADILASRELFALAAYQRAPLVHAIARALESTKDHTLNERFFADLLGRAFTEGDARAQLVAAIDWGRYGELFKFDSTSGELRLDHRGRGFVSDSTASALHAT